MLDSSILGSALEFLCAISFASPESLLARSPSGSLLPLHTPEQHLAAHRSSLHMSELLQCSCGMTAPASGQSNLNAVTLQTTMASEACHSHPTSCASSLPNLWGFCGCLQESLCTMEGLQPSSAASCPSLESTPSCASFSSLSASTLSSHSSPEQTKPKHTHTTGSAHKIPKWENAQTNKQTTKQTKKQNMSN